MRIEVCDLINKNIRVHSYHAKNRNNDEGKNIVPVVEGDVLLTNTQNQPQDKDISCLNHNKIDVTKRGGERH